MHIDRRTQIADAALEVLAREGARGLTHRAVDRAVGLPQGSTSYYFRTRVALLRGAAERLLEIDARDVEEASARGGGAALMARWLAPARRSHLLSRFELLLASAREPSFDFMKSARERFVEGVERSLRQRGKKRARSAAVAYVATLEGLLLHALVSGALSKRESARILEGVASAVAPPSRR